MSNLTFMGTHWTALARQVEMSEKYVYSDQNT
jgi:hypothetical protein